MENKEKQYIKLRFGLSLKKILDRNKEISIENERNGIKDADLITSYGKLEISSGIPKATLIQIVSGNKNAASTTLAAILDALEMKLHQFGTVYDTLTEREIEEYKINLDTNKKQRLLKKNVSKKKPKKRK